MKLRLATIATVIAVLLTCFSGAASALGMQAGDTSPAFNVRTMDGDIFESEEYRGKVLVISFWATWCSSCREEMQFLYRLSQKISDKVVIVAINEETAEYDDKIIEHIHKVHAPQRLGRLLHADEMILLAERIWMQKLRPDAIDEPVDYERLDHLAAAGDLLDNAVGFEPALGGVDY